jgi:hypothetical protein
VTLPARFPGISSIFLHAVSFDETTWPRLPGGVIKSCRHWAAAERPDVVAGIARELAAAG